MKDIVKGIIIGIVGIAFCSECYSRGYNKGVKDYESVVDMVVQVQNTVEENKKKR